MKKVFICYLVDGLSETVVTSFQCVSDDMANYICSNLIKDNEKLGVISDHLLVYKGGTFDVAESVSEIREHCIALDSIDFSKFVVESNNKSKLNLVKE